MPDAPDLGELLEECASSVELWERRAWYWREVAVQFASGAREPYPVPATGAESLLSTAPRFACWAPEPEPPMPLAASFLRHWWAHTNPIGRTEAR